MKIRKHPHRAGVRLAASLMPIAALVAKALQGQDKTFQAGLLLLSTLTALSSDFEYATNNVGEIAIWRYTGRGGSVAVPEMINGRPVVEIASRAFESSISLSTVTFPKSVSFLGPEALANCPNLKAVFFQGDAPGAIDVGDSPFSNSTNAVCYYLPGTKNWERSDIGFIGYFGVPRVLWDPQVRADSPQFGVRGQSFGLSITGTASIPIVVEAAPSPLGAAWTSVISCTLTNGYIYIEDPDWHNHPARYYRIRSP